MSERLNLLQEGLVLLFEAAEGAIDLAQAVFVQLLPFLLNFEFKSLPVVFKLAHQKTFPVRIDL